MTIFVSFKKKFNKNTKKSEKIDDLCLTKAQKQCILVLYGFSRASRL